MAALDFPATPTNGQVFTSNGSSWTYDSAKVAWRSSPYEPGAAITSSTAPTNPQNGDIWYDTDDGTTYVYYNDGTSAQWTEIRSQIATSQVGLVPMIPSSVAVGSGSASVDIRGNVTFTGASSVSLNNVFSSTYKNYRLIANIPTSSAITSLSVKFRTGTTDNSTGSYYQYWSMKRISGVVQDNSGGPSTSYALFGKANSNTYGAWTGDIMSPFHTDQATTVSGIGHGGDSTNSYNLFNTVLFDATTSFDGITFISGSGGTIGGTVKIYGYN